MSGFQGIVAHDHVQGPCVQLSCSELYLLLVHLSDPGGFWFVLVGTTLASFTNTLEWSAPTMLSNTWFPPNERAIATTVFGALAPQVLLDTGTCIQKVLY